VVDGVHSLLEHVHVGADSLHLGLDLFAHVRYLAQLLAHAVVNQSLHILTFSHLLLGMAVGIGTIVIIDIYISFN